MKYLKVSWIHNNEDYPIDFYFELDDDFNELKKIEIYKNGLVGYADKENEINGTIVSEEKIPSSDEISKQKEFILVEITKEEFYKIYIERVKGKII